MTVLKDIKILKHSTFYYCLIHIDSSLQNYKNLFTVSYALLKSIKAAKVDSLHIFLVKIILVIVKKNNQ